jgi:hypothetical protein
LPDTTQFKPVGGGRLAPAERGRSLRGVRAGGRKFANFGIIASNGERHLRPTKISALSEAE